MVSEMLLVTKLFGDPTLPFQANTMERYKVSSTLSVRRSMECLCDQRRLYEILLTVPSLLPKWTSRLSGDQSPVVRAGAPVDLLVDQVQI